MIAQLTLLIVVSFRSLWAHRVKSGIVGTILFFGTLLLVAGTSMLDSVTAAMERSITGSLAGHVQVYDKGARDDLALFGGMSMGSTDIGELPEFSKIEAAIGAMPEVAAVVPMGIVNSMAMSGNELDTLLGHLRDAVRTGDEPAIQQIRAQIEGISSSIQDELRYREAILANKSKVEEDRAALEEVRTDAFWERLRTAPDEALAFLDGRVAPQANDGRMYYLRMVGTDLSQFAQVFDRLRVVDGEKVPDGKRGLLLSKRTYEKLLKHKVARELDAIKKARDEEDRRFTTDTLLADQLARNTRQYQRILFQLETIQAQELKAELQRYLGSNEPELTALLQAFLAADDTNFDERYAWFYEHIAPRIRLYDIRVGDIVTLRAFTQSGYLKSVNVRVYGTYEFAGLERADIGTAVNLTDLVTFRELYGKQTEAQRAELADIRAAVGVQTIDRGSAEDALFGGGGGDVGGGDAPAAGGLETTATVSGFDEFAGVEITKRADGPVVDEQIYSPEEMRSGLALNAAVVLHDPASTGAVEAKLDAMGDSLGIQAVDWVSAAGMLGQLMVVVRIVLYVAVSIIFLVALVIINNTMVMATMDRVGEIGTMRAIGAQRGFVMGMFLIETLVLGLVTGGLGAGAGVALITWLHQVGVPATGADIMVLIFSGPRLYPTWEVGNVLFGLGVIVIVSLIATFYPALLAARVSPRVAIAGKE